MPPLQTMPLPSREAAGLSAAVKELAVRLHLNPTVLVDHAGDEHGEVPAAAAERLERAHGAGTALAARLRIEGPQAQAFAGIITYYALSLLREEKSAAPGSVDAERIQEIEDAAINDVRAGYGEDAAAEAAREIASLRP